MKQTGGPRTHSLLAFVAWLVWAVQVPILTLVVPRFHEIFNDFEVELPLITALLLKVAMQLSSVLAVAREWISPEWLAIIVATKCAVMLGVVAFFVRRKAVVLVIAFAAGFILILVEAACLFVPLTRMIESVSGGKV